MASTAPLNRIDSPNASHSVGPFCRSFFATAVLHLFEEEKRKVDLTAEYAWTGLPKERRAYLEFETEFHDALARLKKKGAVSQNQFVVQDWYQLDTTSSTVDTITSRTGNMSLNKDKQHRVTPEHQLKADILVRECKLYLYRHPGPYDTQGNKKFHDTMMGIIGGRYSTTNPYNQEKVYKQVMYRKNVAKLATELLILAQIPLPHRRNCAHFDQTCFERDLATELMSKYYIASSKVHHMGVLPRAAVDGSQGSGWSKPAKYIAAAVALDRSIKDEADIVAALERMRICYKSLFQHIKARLDEDEELMRKKGAWFDVLRSEGPTSW
ncbi:hypothetical protein G6011_00879 [Alternaria panax]|uniref:Uncharacterized protein n=1 Tax=Alternaria panax TaxID=48097 RepID=A0AAD4NVD0_9PLEO|nr:hypothetical protein G6011_00879 [Alternaria panax]